MPQPNVKELIVAGPLQEISLQYRNMMYVGDRVFPLIDTGDPKAKIARYLKGAWFRDEAGIRGPGSRANRGGYPVDFIDIATKEYAFAKEVTDEDRRFVGSTGAPPLMPDQDAIEFASDKVDLSKERRIMALITATDWSGAGVGGEDVAGLWAINDATNTFLVDVTTRIETIRSNTGMRPNVLLVSADTWAKLILVDAIMDRIRYTERAVMTPGIMAAILKIDEVLISDAIYSTAKETKAGTDFTSADVFSVNAGKGAAFLCHRPARPGLKTPMAGVQVRLRFGQNEGGQVRRTTTWREAAEHQDVYEVAEETAIVATGTDLGFLWKDTILT